MRNATLSDDFESSFVSTVKVTGRPLTDIAPWVMYLNSPGFGARSVAEKYVPSAWGPLRS